MNRGGRARSVSVAAAALHYLGHEHQIETVLRADGPIGDGVLRGNLVLEAAGDPTWSRIFFEADPDAPFRALAEEVRRACVARVDGDLILDLSRFPGRGAPVSRSQMEMGLGFAAPVSGLAVDENTAEVRIAPVPPVVPSPAASARRDEMPEAIVAINRKSRPASATM